MLRDAFGVRVIARGDTLTVEGPAESVDLTERVVTQLRSILRSAGQLQPEEVRSTLAVIQANGSQPPTPVGSRDHSRGFRPRTDGQARYVRALHDNDITLCIGPAGTGKTYLATAFAVTQLRAGNARRLVLVRPAVEAGEKLGYLPGDLQAKINPYLRPLFDALNDLMEPEQVKKYLETDVIEIAPLAYMRGRTLNHAVVILDEGQNTTIPQMKMFLTRLGQNSKMVVTGDVTQNDLPDKMKSGLNDAIHRLKNIERVGCVFLDETDIVRHPLVQKIVRAYEPKK
ncbi:MAG: PhoH family protein [Gemmataceae bacterium]|nr:PhoH family protein [Gemmataceae bacterium]